MTFPILKLPILAVEHILHRFDDCDLIFMTLSSKKCARIIGSLRSMYSRIEICIQDWGRSIDLYRDGEDRMSCTRWNFLTVQMRRKRKPNLTINGVKMFCVQSSSQWIDQEKDRGSSFEIGYFKQNTGRELEMGAVASHILNVFINCKQTSLHIDFGNLEFDLETFLSFIDHIENLTVRGNSDSCQNDIISILKNVRVTKCLISETLITNPEVLLYLNTPRVEMKRSTLNSDVIVKFLLKWRNSDREMNKIEIVIIHSTGKITTLDYQKLDAKPWDSKKREKVYRKMTDVPAFPLFPLPHLARVHIIKLMDVLEQYHLSTLSKKTRKLVNICYIPCILELQLISFDRSLGEHAVLYISKDQRSERYSILITTNDYVAKPCDSKHAVVLKVENWRKVVVEQLEFVNEQFRTSRFKIEFIGVPDDMTRQLLGDVKRLRINIYHFLVDSCGEVNDELYEWIMDECRDVKRLTTSCLITQNFQWNSDKPFTLERCFLYAAPFLTLDHLTRLFWGCRFFETVNSRHKMTSQDLNQLVKLWMEGDSKLEYLGIGVNRSINFHEVMENIEKVPVESARVENYLENFDEGHAFKIRRNNGMEAVVCFSMGDHFVITTHFNDQDCDLFSF